MVGPDMRLAVRVETGDVRWLGGSITNGDVHSSIPERDSKTKDGDVDC